MSQGDTGMDAVRVIRISLQVLGERAFSLLAMLMTFRSEEHTSELQSLS